MPQEATKTVPLIGITGMWSDSVHGLRFAGLAVAVKVLEAVVRAGGEPVVLFPDSRLPMPQRLARLDGVLVPGGADLNPALYGQAPHHATSVADYEGQDAFESEVIASAIDLNKPLLAICRGFQLLNVVYGGSLQQHLGDDHAVHTNGIHPVVTEPGSLLQEILPDPEFPVSSYHHQAVDTVGDQLRVSGRAADGIVEALELPGSPVVGIQWHPEDTAGHDNAAHTLFAWLVTEAAKDGGNGER